VLVVDNNTDNVLATFRFKNAAVKMEAAEEDFTVDGHALRAGHLSARCGGSGHERAGFDQVLGLIAYATPSVA